MVYVACHTYHMGANMTEIMHAAGERLRLVHVADTMDHHRSHGLRYITNPPGSPARVHQHLKIGDGDATSSGGADEPCDGADPHLLAVGEQRLVGTDRRLAGAACAIRRGRVPGQQGVVPGRRERVGGEVRTRLAGPLRPDQQQPKDSGFRVGAFANFWTGS